MSRFDHFYLLIVVAIVFMTSNHLIAKDQAKPEKFQKKVSYNRDILPIFRANCQGCHQPARAKGEYVMTDFASLLKGGESEDTAVIPSKPAESNLLAQLIPEDGKAEMPAGKKPLSNYDLGLIRKWIAQGAINDQPPLKRTRIDAKHPPVYHLPPVISSLDFSPDGKLLAITGYHEIIIYKADGSGLVNRLVGLSERVESIKFSPDGKYLAATGGNPGRLGEVQIWNIKKSKLIQSVPVTFDTLYGVNWSPDGKLISFGCSDNTVRVIEAKSGKQVLFNGAHSDWIFDTVFSVKGTHLITVSRDRSMKLMEVKTQRFVDNITSITPGALKGGILSVTRHPSKDELLIGGSDGVPKIYKMLRTKARKIGDDFNLIRKFKGLPGRVFSVAYSKDGNQIVAGSSNQGKGTVRVYNANDAKMIAELQGQQGGVFAVCFNQAGTVVASAGFDGFIRLNDAKTGKLLKKFVPIKLVKKNLKTTAQK